MAERCGTQLHWESSRGKATAWPLGQLNPAVDPIATDYGAKPENELLEHAHAERLDFGTTRTSIRADSEMEAVGAVHGAKDKEGKSQGGQELG